jgi:hypothetical protein
MPDDIEIAFRAWFNESQPLFAVQHKTGKRLTDIDQIREIRNQIEAAYRSGWVARGPVVRKQIEEAYHRGWVDRGAVPPGIEKVD